MSEPETAQEPTMEEILASIRRIISEDDGGSETTETSAEEVEVAEVVAEEDLTEEPVYQETSQEAPEQTLQDPPQAEERETSNPDDERYASITAVFSGRQREQADELEEFGDEYEAEAEMGAETEGEAAPAFEPVDQPEPQSFGESQYEAEEPSVDDVEAFFGNDNDEAAPDFAKTDFGEPVTVEEQVAAASTHEVSFEAAAQNVVEEEVLSPDTENRVASLLGQLNETQPAIDPAPSSAEASSVEGLVREMLRPMLQNWLDENLPPLVERIVEREIKRVTRAR